MKSQFPPNLDEDEPLFRTDSFRMFCFKVLPCSKRFCHDWTTCPFSHPAEKAKRRDPRVHVYTGVACPDQKKNASCPRGDTCTFAHNVFEYHLHPSRYRTALCNDGVNCSRKICFFAHTMDELRVSSVKVVPPESAAAKLSSPISDTFDLDPFNCQEESSQGKPRSSTSPISPLTLEPSGSLEGSGGRRSVETQYKPKRMSHEIARSSQYKQGLLQKQRNSVDSTSATSELHLQQMQLRSVEAALNAQLQMQLQHTSLQSLALGRHDGAGVGSNVGQLAQALAHLQLASRLAVGQDGMLPSAMPPLPPPQQPQVPNLTHVLVQQLLLQQQQQAHDQLLHHLQMSGGSPNVGMLMPGQQAVMGSGLPSGRNSRSHIQASGCGSSMGDYNTGKQAGAEYSILQDLGGSGQHKQFSQNMLGGV